MEDRIQGTVLPVLEVGLQPGESVVSEAGEFSWMTDTVEMSTGTSGASKGFLGAIKRVAGGSSLMLSTYTAGAGPGMVAFAAKVPGKILSVDVAPGTEYMVHRRGFLCGMPGIEISAGFQQSFRGGIFGGEGFILQKLGGTAKAWVELSGEVVTYNLVAGQTMRAHPGHVGMFQTSVSFQVIRTPGLMNRYFGEDGHHMAVLTGPGSIWLQSMPLPNLAGALAPFLPGSTSSTVTAGAAGGVAGGVLGDLFGK
ncbi:MAG: AIM24 family protein [Acidimicrobiales bacterium]